MMVSRRGLRERLTYANVMATLALFVALGGVSYASFNLPKNSVGSPQLRKNSVKTGDIARNAIRVGKIDKEAVKAGKLAKNAVPTNRLRTNAVTGIKVRDGSLTGADLADQTISGIDVADGSLSGSDIDQASLTGVRASNVTGIAIDNKCMAATPHPSGVSSESSGFGCIVTFSSNIQNCAITATPAVRVSGPGAVKLAERSAWTLRSTEAPNVVSVATFSGETATPLAVDLIVLC